MAIFLAASAFNGWSAAPTTVSITPLPGSTVSSLSAVTVVFSTNIAGVQAADLLVNGEPATSVSASNATARYQFSQPAPGTVTVYFDEDAVITDLAGNLFNTLGAGTAWTYTLADGIAPTVLSAEPAFGSVVGSLSFVEVKFSEKVSGVDAADFLVNGTPATGVTAIAPDRYRFEFPPPAAGPVNVSFASSHGIRDLSPAANSFPGAGWAYTINPSASSGDVVINEFLVENRNSLQDEDGQKEDWIELWNRGGSSVNLTGWALTDDPNEPGKWTFPNLTLNAGQYLIVFASGKDRKTTAANATNHTSFRLNLANGYLGLYGATSPRVAVSEYVNYPEQRADISYGRKADGTASYFGTLTPRAANAEASAASGFVQAPRASVPSGFFDRPFNLTLASETAGAEIHYTLDGSVPTLTNEIYAGPLVIAGAPRRGVVTLRAVGFKAGQVPSTATTHTYIFPDNVLTQPANPDGFPMIWDSPCTGFNNCNDINPADYEMDPQIITNAVDNYGALARQGLLSIPSVSIVTDVRLLFGAAEGVYVRREPFLRQPINAEFLTVDGSPGFQIDCGLEMQGQTSPDDSSTGGSRWKSLKLGLRLFFEGKFGPTKLRYKVYPDSPVEEFDTLMLGGGHNNYWNYNNNDTQRTRALYVRDQYVANLQLGMGGLTHHGRFVHLYLNGLYWGLYQLHERPDDSHAASYQGGEPGDYDVFKHDAVTPANVIAGSTASYSQMWTLLTAALTNNAQYEAAIQYVDPADLIDYLLCNYWANNTDWAHKNLYASHRKQGGQWRFHAWDSEHTCVDADFAVLSDNEGTNPTAVFNRLRVNAEFRQLLADRIHKHFFNGGIFYVDPLHPVYDSVFPQRNPAAHLFMTMLKSIDTAIVCESARWGDVGPGRETTPHTRNVSFYDERDVVMGYRPTFGLHSTFNFSTRSIDLLAQFRQLGWYPAVVAPSFNQHGGRVPAGFNLVMTAPAGTIYYTTNGVDPRVYGSGAISAHARASAGPISVGSSLRVKARVWNGTAWSALNEADFTVAQLESPLRITEIMYNPAAGDACEFLELRNTGALPIDVGGYSFDGITFSFPPQTVIDAGATFVVANNDNPAAFAQCYPGVNVGGYFAGSLNNGGERLALKNAAGETVTSVVYRDAGGWPLAADGAGASLELLDVNGPQSDPANWQARAGAAGSPGQANPTPAAGAVVLNEIAAENLSAVDHAGTFPDWVELANTSGAPVDLGGWSLSDDANPRKLVLPAGTIIPANGYLVIWCDATTNVTPGLHAGFALDRQGDHVFLYNAQTQRVDAVGFGAQLANYTIGKVGGEWALTSPTPSAANVAAATGPASSLSINEWLANAAPGENDWVELFNQSPTLPVGLRGVHVTSGGAVFRIRSLSFVAPRGYVQLVADEGGDVDHLDFKLPAAAGDIAIFDAAAVLVDRVTYGPQTEAISEGRLPDGSATVVSFPGSVSPGAANYAANYTGPRLHEVLARNTTTLSPWSSYADWIELANDSGSVVNIGGMSLAASRTGSRWVIPAGTTVPANGYLRIWCDGERAASLTATADLNAGFSLAGESGGVYLFNASGQLMDFVEYGLQVQDLSIGRVVVGGAWRLLAAPTPGAVNSGPAALGSAAALRLNEWMADPLSGNDWIELHNPGLQAVDLAGLYLTDDPSLLGVSKFQVAPLSYIGAGGFAVFEADGDPSQGRQHLNFNLDRYGETIRLYGTNLALLDSADVVSLPPGVSAGRLPDGAESTSTFYTTPSRNGPNYLPLPGVVIHEVLSHADVPLQDSIELFNAGTQSVSLAGFYLSDSAANLKKFRIAAGVTLAAGGYLVFDETQFNSGAPGSFTLSGSRGGVVYLSAADAGGVLTGYRSVFPFGPQLNGVSFGPIATSVGVDVVPLTSRTFGGANPAPVVGPVVINEVQYHPVDGVEAAENASQEYIELYNLSGATVSLFDVANPGNTWRLRGGVTFQFPASATIPPAGYALLVSFDPSAAPATATAFRARYGLPAGVPLLGPFSGRLGNGGDELILERPDAPQPAPEAGFVPYVIVDRVNYGPVYPWPEPANGGGASLQRRRPTDYGNDPIHWKALPPTAGRANVNGSTYADADQDGLPDAYETANGLNPALAADAPLDADGDGRSNLDEYFDETNPKSAASHLEAPVIVSQPADAATIPGDVITLSVSLSAGAPAQYQWYRNGVPVAGATSASIVLGPMLASDTASYSVVAWNAVGFAASRIARVVVGVPPRITSQPAWQIVNPGAAATFSVAATGAGTVRYQWQRDGEDIAGATSASLTIGNAQLANEGEYRAVVSDDVSSIRSAGARLVVKVPATIVTPLVGQTNTVGSSVSFTVVAAGSVPMFYQWRKGSQIITNYSLTNRTATFTLNNLTLADSGTYRAVVTNLASATPVATPLVRLDVFEPPVITSQPQSLTVEPGAPAAFSVTATGTALRYQWQRNLAPIADATNATLSIAAAQAADAGSYRVIVFNPAASVTSSPAVLTVGSLPLVLSDLQVLPNGDVRMNISGPPNRTYYIEISPDLAAWTLLGPIQYTNGLMPYIDSSSAGSTNRFYRARP